MSEIVRLAILDTYGVRWSRETFARDVLQNFFDAAPNFSGFDIRRDHASGVLELRGASSFALGLLSYIGATTKRDGKTAGGFGEGFKICALVGVRDFGLSIHAGSQDFEFEVSLEPVPLGRELCYRVQRVPHREGSFVRLVGCDAACFAAFAAAEVMFRYPQNPKLQEPLVLDAEGGVALYLSPLSREGELYYRRQLRGVVGFYGATRQSRPLTLAYDGVLDALEGDRDRRDLSARALAVAIGKELSEEDLYKVLIYLQLYWVYGHEVLSGLIEAGISRRLSYSWPRGWLARDGKDESLSKFAERQGFKLALTDFAKLGMPTARNTYKGDLATRTPTPLESARLTVAAELYTTLNGAPAKLQKYEVFDGKAAILGQHLGDKVLVGAALLVGGLEQVADTMLHELAHEVGGEESAAFLGRLKKLLRASLEKPEAIIAAKKQYQEATEADVPIASIVEPAKPLPESYDPVDYGCVPLDPVKGLSDG